MGSRHKHADLIHKWCEGADIEYRIKGLSTWDYDNYPAWNSDAYEFRLKEPEEKKPAVRWLWADKIGRMSKELYSEDEVAAENARGSIFSIKLEWSRTEFPE